MSEADNSLCESVKECLRAIDMSLSSLQKDFDNFKNSFVTATNHILFDEGLFDRYDNKDQIFEEEFIYDKSDKRQRGELEVSKWWPSLNFWPLLT